MKSREENGISSSSDRNPGTDISAKATFGLKHIEWTGDALTPILFWDAARELEPFFKNADRTIETILTANSVRLVVLEAWLFCDLGIRTIVLATIDQKHVNLPEYDLRYECLPSSFERCAQLLVKIRKVNAALPRDPEERRVTINVEFFQFLYKEDRAFVDRFMELEQAFYQCKHPDLAKQVHTHDPLAVSFGEPSLLNRAPKTKFARVPKGWLEATQLVDDEWLKRAARLNGARNKAAHSYDEKAIAKKLGIRGPHTIHRVREECLQILTELWGFHVDKEVANPTS